MAIRLLSLEQLAHLALVPDAVPCANHDFLDNSTYDLLETALRPPDA
jgi:hypothetical protein